MLPVFARRLMDVLRPDAVTAAESMVIMLLLQDGGCSLPEAMRTVFLQAGITACRRHNARRATGAAVTAARWSALYSAVYYLRYRRQYERLWTDGRGKLAAARLQNWLSKPSVRLLLHGERIGLTESLYFCCRQIAPSHLPRMVEGMRVLLAAGLLDSGYWRILMADSRRAGERVVGEFFAVHREEKRTAPPPPPPPPPPPSPEDPRTRAERILGVTAGTDRATLQRRFRRLAVRMHPDKFARASAAVREQAHLRFIELREAYELLCGDAA